MSSTTIQDTPSSAMVLASAPRSAAARSTIAKGDRFGRLVVLGKVPGKHPSGKTHYDCQCDCGKTCQVRGGNLTQGITQSCGCYRWERQRTSITKHGHTVGNKSSPEYSAWRSMHAACYNKHADVYAYVGKKGIRVCRVWHADFEAFLASVGPRPSADHVLTRKNNTKDFTPQNTIWATSHDALRNKRNSRKFTVGGVTKNLEDWAEEAKIGKSTLHYRLSKGLTMKEALALGHGTSGKAIT